MHVGAFGLGRLVPVDVPDADAVAGRGQRGGHGLQGTGPDGGDYGRLFAGDPAQGGSGVGRFRLVADGQGTHQAMVLVGAQDVGQRRGPVPEDAEIGANAQAEQAEHHGLGHGDIGPAGERSAGPGRPQAPGPGEGRRPLLPAAGGGTVGPDGRDMGLGPRNTSHGATVLAPGSGVNARRRGHP